MENIEIWKDIENYEGFYQVSNLGRVRSLERDIYSLNGKLAYHTKEKILVPVFNNRGYACVHLCKNGKMKNMLVHRLVALAFIPNPENKSQINHKNEVKTDNFVENLEWCDNKYNALYGTRIQRCVQNRRSFKFGDNPQAKAVFCEELNKTFDCASRAEEELGIWGSCIRSACKGKLKTAGGFHWKYADEND